MARNNSIEQKLDNISRRLEVIAGCLEVFLLYNFPKQWQEIKGTINEFNHKVLEGDTPFNDTKNTMEAQH